MNEVYEAETFSELRLLLNKVEQERVERIKDQLRENLFQGKPLHFSWFREKRMNGKRVYYFINEHTRKAVLAAFGEKKYQQRIINELLANREYYFQLLR